MAKLHNYYVLCPLIDQKSFLGVSQDKDKDCVIVTLGRNVINKYRLSDQKQISGWTSKDHITAAIVYDIGQDSYVGVFNNNTIKMWIEGCNNLDKIKKYKFSSNILKLLSRGDQSSIVVFSNGNCAALPYAIENRKTYEWKPLIKDTDAIVDAVCYTLKNTDHICYVVKDSRDRYEIINCPIRDELGDIERPKLNKVKVMRSENTYVVGKLISVEETPVVYILWSDSKISVYNLIEKSWKVIGTVPWVATISTVSMAYMGKNHLILFGCNMDQDGAIIVVYNKALGVGACKYPMKMYSNNAKLYCFNNRIILESSNYIGMLPYVLETKRNLSSLLGSHEIAQDEYTEIADWDSPVTPLYKITKETRDLLKLGLTERSICSQVVAPLLEKNDCKKVLRVLKDFKDIPESVLVLLLKYVVKLVNPVNIDVSNSEEFALFCSSNVNHSEKFELLNYVLQISFSDALLIPYLRNLFDLESALFIMSYISYLLIESDVTMDTDYESRLFDWCTLLMDAFYQQCLMTKDEKVTNVLEKMKKVVVTLIKELMVVDSVLPILNQFLYGKPLEDNEESSYAIEVMEI